MACRCGIGPASAQGAECGAPGPGSICVGPDVEGRTSKSKIAVGMYTVAQAFGMSTTPDNRPSIGAAPRIR